VIDLASDETLVSGSDGHGHRRIDDACPTVYVCGVQSGVVCFVRGDRTGRHGDQAVAGVRVPPGRSSRRQTFALDVEVGGPFVFCIESQRLFPGWCSSARRGKKLLVVGVDSPNRTRRDRSAREACAG
jgi:hypothetical protein